MERYSEYKPSEIQWLSEIPSHWGEMRSKYLMSQITESSTSSHKIGLENIESFTGKFIETGSVFDGNGIAFIIGDIVYGKLRPYLCKSWLATFCGNAVGDFYVFRPSKDINESYLNYIMMSDGFTNICNASTYGAKMPRVAASFIKSLYFPLPPLAEQKKIVSFIEDKSTKIDTFIAEKEKELNLLDELKQTEIENVVTKGLSPNVTMKDSGISWIGQIPEHWSIKRAKYMFTKHKRPILPEDEVVTCFRDGEVTLRKNRRTTGFTESLTETGYQRVHKGDLVIHQMDAFAGSIGISDSYGKATPVLHCCTPTSNTLHTRYYMYAIRQMAYSGFIQSLYRGIRERSSDFNFQVFSAQYLPIPPYEEQLRIVEYIDSKVNSINSLKSELKAEIEYLKEYKLRLVSDAVTGQINVQNL